MLTGAQMRTVGWLTDGGIICPDCAEDGERREMAAICEYSAEEGFSPEGVECDECYKTIVETAILCADCAGDDHESCIGSAGDKCEWCGDIIGEDEEEDEDDEEEDEDDEETSEPAE